MKDTKKTIILDNEWVIVRNDWDNVDALVAEGLGLERLGGKAFKNSLKIPTHDGDLLKEYCTGRRSPKSFYTHVLQSKRRMPTPRNMEIMQYAMSALTTEVDRTAINAIRRLAADGHRLFMLSNSNPDIYTGNSDRHDYFTMFEKCYFSFRIGVRKPDTRAWLTVIEENGLDPSDCIFVDDKEVNLAAARSPAVGMTAVYHKIGEGDLYKRLEELL